MSATARAAALLAGLHAAACGGVQDGNPLPELDEYARAAGARFEVVCHFRCAGAAEEALSVAELAARRAGELFPADSAAERSVVRLYRAEAFRAVVAALAREDLEEGAAFSSPQRRTAYVELVPPVAEERLAEAGLPTPTLRLIAHEAAHLSFYAASGGAPRLPDWLSEGAAQSVERAVARELGLFPGTDDPRLAAQTWRAYSLERTGALPSLAGILAEGADVARDRADYALRALAYEFLGEREPELFDSLIATAARRIGARDLPDSLAAVAVRRTGAGKGAAAAALDSAFARYVVERAAGSRWLQVRGIASGRPLRHAGLPGGRVTVLARDPWRSGSVEVSGRLELAGTGDRGRGPGGGARDPGALRPGDRTPDPGAPGPRRDAALGIVVGRSGGSHVAVGFDRGAGAVWALRERGRGGVVSASSEVGRAAVELPARLSFRVRLAPDAAPGSRGSIVEVWVDGARVLRGRVGEGDGRGDWGVFAEPGAAGVWHGLGAASPPH